jgi:hypothetical protein
MIYATACARHLRQMRRSPENRPDAKSWLSGTVPNRLARTSSWLQVTTHTEILVQSITSGLDWPATTKRTQMA